MFDLQYQGCSRSGSLWKVFYKKKAFLKNSQNLLENTCAIVFFKSSCTPEVFLKNLQHLHLCHSFFFTRKMNELQQNE